MKKTREREEKKKLEREVSLQEEREEKAPNFEEAFWERERERLVSWENYIKLIFKNKNSLFSLKKN